MQFGHALDHILREILLANPAFGPVHLLKLDISDGFYRIALNVDDIPKLGVAFPTADNADPLVALPLVLPMGWKNSPPIFSTATETIADIANAHITAFVPHVPHHLDDMAELILSSPLALGGSTVAPLLVTRDPSLPSLPTSLAYVDVYVDDFVGAAQCSPAGSQDLDNRCCVRRLLLQAVDDVFCPLSHGDGPDRREPVSMKKLAAGDCSWGTVKQVLGWVIDTVDMTIALPPHRATRLLEILDSFPPSQRRTSTKRWHGALGELRLMALALPGARHIFSSMQNALSTQSKNRHALGNGVHDALANIQWMHSNISTRPTRIAELVPLPPVWGTMTLRGRGPGGSGSQATTSHLVRATRPPPHLCGNMNGQHTSPPGLSLTPTPQAALPTRTLNWPENCCIGTPLHTPSMSGNAPSFHKATTLAQRFGNRTAVRPPLLHRHTCCGFLASTNNTIVTFLALTTFPAPPTTSPIPSPTTFIYHGLPCSPRFPPTFLSRLVVKSGPHHRRSFPR
jgi:hypothetical protein